MVSQSFSTWSMRWVEKRMALPCSLSSSSVRSSSVAFTGSRPEKGSSITISPGIVQHAADELDLLLHALGELFGLLGQGVGDLHAFGPVDGPLARFFRREAVQLAEEDELVDHLHLLVEAALFGQVADALEALAFEGLAEEAHPAGVGHGDAHHHANGTGLSGAVRAREARTSVRLRSEG